MFDLTRIEPDNKNETAKCETRILNLQIFKIDSSTCSRKSNTKFNSII